MIAKLAASALLTAMQAADVVTTNLIPWEEANPATLWLLGLLGEWWWLPKAVILLAVIAGVLRVGVPVRSLAALSLFYAAVLAINLSNVLAVYGWEHG